MGTKNELLVLVKAKELAKYSFEVLEKAPKKFRYVFVNRIENLILDIVSEIAMANTYKDLMERIKHQKDAKRSILVLDNLIFIARESECISLKTMENMSKFLAEVSNALSKWIISTQKLISTDLKSD